MMLEKDIESAFQRKAKSNGWLTQKLDSGKISRGWPDRLIVLPGGSVVFIEFKTAKGKLSELQAYRISQLRDYGQNVYVCRSWQEAVEACQNHL